MKTVLLVTCLVLAGCGQQSPTDQVRDTITSLAKNARAHHWAAYCDQTTTPGACQKDVAGALALGIDPADFVPTDDMIDKARIKIDQDGKSATVDTTAARDAIYMRLSGRWVFLWEGE